MFQKSHQQGQRVPTDLQTSSPKPSMNSRSPLTQVKFELKKRNISITENPAVFAQKLSDCGYSLGKVQPVLTPNVSNKSGQWPFGFK